MGSTINLVLNVASRFFSFFDITVNHNEDMAQRNRNQFLVILTAQLQDSRLYYDTDMTCATAIVMGTESTGLTTSWREAADAHIRIPMNGKLDSLNVSVSAAVLLYEAVRQRLTSTGCSRSS